MKRLFRRFAAGALVAALAGPAAAQTVGMGTLPQGSLGFAITAAIAKVVSEKTDIQARAVGQGGSNVFIPQVNRGELEFSSSNVVEAVYAYTGTGNFDGQKNADIRMAAALMPFTVGVMVRDRSDVKTIRDLKGRPFATDYTSQKLVQVFLEAVLAAEGMKIDDLDRVPAANFIKGAELTAQGRVEGVVLAPGSAVVAQMDATEPMRFLSITRSPEGLAAMQRVAPGAYYLDVQPAPNLPGVKGPTTLMGYEYALLAGAGADAELVYRVVKAVHENKDALAAAHGVYRGFDPAKMVVDTAVPYHEGAIRYYREVGLWPAS